MSLPKYLTVAWILSQGSSYQKDYEKEDYYYSLPRTNLYEASDEEFSPNSLEQLTETGYQSPLTRNYQSATSSYENQGSNLRVYSKGPYEREDALSYSLSDILKDYLASANPLSGLDYDLPSFLGNALDYKDLTGSSYLVVPLKLDYEITKSSNCEESDFDYLADVNNKNSQSGDKLYLDKLNFYRVLTDDNPLYVQEAIGYLDELVVERDVPNLIEKIIQDISGYITQDDYLMRQKIVSMEDFSEAFNYSLISEDGPINILENKDYSLEQVSNDSYSLEETASEIYQIFWEKAMELKDSNLDYSEALKEFEQIIEEDEKEKRKRRNKNLLGLYGFDANLKMIDRMLPNDDGELSPEMPLLNYR